MIVCGTRMRYMISTCSIDLFVPCEGELKAEVFRFYLVRHIRTPVLRTDTCTCTILLEVTE